jgi:hypothetical protein
MNDVINLLNLLLTTVFQVINTMLNWYIMLILLFLALSFFTLLMEYVEQKTRGSAYER